MTDVTVTVMVMKSPDSYYHQAFGYTWKKQITIWIFVLLQPVSTHNVYATTHNFHLGTPGTDLGVYSGRSWSLSVQRRVPRARGQLALIQNADQDARPHSYPSRHINPTHTHPQPRNIRYGR